MIDERLKKSAGEGRRNRAMEDRTVTENRELSDDERVEMFQQQFFQSALPDLPKLSGWHVCWLTTTNPRDTIQNRMQLGYVPVKPEDIPGWEYATLKTGDWAGFIGVNEMLAFKLPMRLYEKYMHVAHYKAPLEEEEKLTDISDFLERDSRETKSRIDMGDGTRDLGLKREGSFDLE